MNRTFMTLIEYWRIRPIYQPSLGRWKVNDNVKRKIDLANIDNCGDRLCGIPINKDLKNNYDKSFNRIIEDYNRRWNKNINIKDFKDNFHK